MPDLNGKSGIVKSALTNGRHQVYVADMSKTFALKPTNLKYEIRSASSLSIKELIAVLKAENGDSEDLTGMEKSELQSKVALISEEKIAEILAVANAPAARPTRTVAAPALDPTQAASQLENIDPAQLRQQAMAMKQMDPATIRRMNPQFRNMTDQQIRMAADQMLLMANNPTMMKQYTEQMKKMKPEELQHMQNQMMGGGDVPAATSGQTRQTKTNASPRPKKEKTMHDQYQEASKQMANMTPEQLKQQAAMMKSMEPDTLRAMNPHFASMSDAQIRQAADQFEMMASNPEMLRMAMDSIKDLSPEEAEKLQKEGMTSMNSAAPNQAAGGSPGMNPSDMLKNMDKKQLKNMLKMVQGNPEMLKQFAGMSGMSDDQLKSIVDNLAQMDDDKLDKAVYMMQKAQGAKDLWSKVNGMAGGQLLKIVIASVVLLAFLVLRWLFGGGGGVADASLNAAPPVPDIDEIETEF